jgi:alpha-1,2-mannosyltransferase
MGQRTAAFWAWASRPGVFRTALLILLFALSIQYSFKVLKPSRDGSYTRGAINRWVNQIQSGVEDGVDIHAKYNYPNPPIMALILWPVTECATVHPLAGALVWFYLKVAMVFWALTALFRQVTPPGFLMPPWACALATVLSLRPIMGDLSHGNVNIFIMVTVLAGLIAFVRGYDMLAGLCIALAVACKVTPALFLVYFGWKRAWRVLAGAGLGLGVFFFLVPALFLGWDANLQALQSWYAGMVKPFVTGTFVTSEHNNQSLPGWIYRLFTHSPAFSTYVDNVYTPTEYWNIFTLTTDQAKRLQQACMAGFAVLGIRLCRGASQPLAARYVLWAEFSLVAIGMLLFSERTWKHHCVMLLLPNAVLCCALAQGQLSRARQRGLIALLGASQLAMFTTSTGAFPDAFAKAAQVYGAYIVAFFCLVAGLVLIHRNKEAKTANDARSAAVVGPAPAMAA